MAEEALVFYPILVPLFLAAGYDLLVPLAIIFGGTSLGCIASFSNPFSVIIASNAAGINWMDGLTERLILWVIVTALLIWYILRYAAKVKKDPKASLVYQIDGDVAPPYELNLAAETSAPKLELKVKLLLFIYLATFLTMIGGVVFLKWWTTEMSTLFLGASILLALITRMNEKVFTQEFIMGAESLLSVAFIVGVARGVTIILNEGNISDSILYYAANLMQGVPPAFFILALMLFYLVFSPVHYNPDPGWRHSLCLLLRSGVTVYPRPGNRKFLPVLQCIMSFVAATGLVFFPGFCLRESQGLASIINPLFIMLLLLCSAFW